MGVGRRQLGRCSWKIEMRQDVIVVTLMMKCSHETCHYVVAS